MILADTHTHRRDASNAIINYDPTVDSYPLDPSKAYSVGIHPWRADEAADEILELTATLACEPSVVAMGETGLDTLRGPAIEEQARLLRWHLDLATRLHKPVILHIVRAWQQLIDITKPFHPFATPYIIHGFRGKPELARQLLRHGFSLSFGEHYNRNSFDITPVDRRYAESDEHTLPTLPGEVNHLKKI